MRVGEGAARHEGGDDGEPGQLDQLAQRLPGGALAVALEVDEVGVEAVAGRAPLVLLDQRARLDRQRALSLVTP